MAQGTIIERDGWTVIGGGANPSTMAGHLAELATITLTDEQVAEMTADIADAALFVPESAGREGNTTEWRRNARRQIAHTRRVEQSSRWSSDEAKAERAAERARVRELKAGDRAAVRELNGHAKRPPYHKIENDGENNCVECGHDIVAAEHTRSGWKHVESWSVIMGTAVAS